MCHPTRTPLRVGTRPFFPPCSAANEATAASGAALCTPAMAALGVAITISFGGAWGGGGGTRREILVLGARGGGLLGPRRGGGRGVGR